MVKTRYAWLDYARLLSLVLIVLMHAQPRMLCVAVGVLAIFFGCAGCLFNPCAYSSFGDFMKRRCTKLLLPYFTFYALFYILWLVAGRRLDPGVDTLTPLWQWLMGLPKHYKPVVVAPFWFITCLLSIQVMFYWIEKSKYAGLWMPMALSVVLSVAVALCPGSEHLNFWNINYALLYMPFYAVGYYLRLHIVNGVRLRWWAFISALAFSIVMMTVVAQRFDSPDWCSVMLVAGGTAVVLPVATIATKVEQWVGRCKMVEFLAVNGITCLALQNYCIGVLRLAISRMWPGADTMSWSLSLLITVCTLAIIGVCAWFLSRYAPWMVKIKKVDKNTSKVD